MQVEIAVKVDRLLVAVHVERVDPTAAVAPN